MKEILGNKLTDQHADEDLMRFLKARKGNPVDAATAFGNFIVFFQFLFIFHFPGN